MKRPTTRFWGQTVLFRHIHIKTYALCFDFVQRSYLFNDIFTFWSSIQLYRDSATVRAIEIVIEIFLIPINVFKPLYGLK